MDISYSHKINFSVRINSILLRIYMLFYDSRKDQYQYINQYHFLSLLYYFGLQGAIEHWDAMHAMAIKRRIDLSLARGVTPRESWLNICRAEFKVRKDGYHLFHRLSPAVSSFITVMIMQSNKKKIHRRSEARINCVERIRMRTFNNDDNERFSGIWFTVWLGNLGAMLNSTKWKTYFKLRVTGKKRRENPYGKKLKEFYQSSFKKLY